MEDGKTLLRNIGYIPKMNRKKFQHQKDQLFYVIKENAVGWYLIVYLNKNEDESSHDYLLDTFDEALIEAEERFGIPKNSWKEIVTDIPHY
jgi:hypothetical protein